MSNILAALCFSFQHVFVLIWGFEQRFWVKFENSCCLFLVFLVEYSLLGSIMIDNYCLKLMFWDAYELSGRQWTLCICFWVETCVVWSCQRLQQKRMNETYCREVFICMDVCMKILENCIMTPQVLPHSTTAQIIGNVHQFDPANVFFISIWIPIWRIWICLIIWRAPMVQFHINWWFLDFCFLCYLVYY